MTPNEASRWLKRAYQEKFYQPPGPTEMLIIALIAPRVAKGEKFVWKEQNNWRILEKEPNYEPD